MMADPPTVPETLDGWFALHDFRRFDRSAWNRLAKSERTDALSEAAEVLRSFEKVEDTPGGHSISYSVVGHKADLLLLHLRPEVGQLHELERAFDSTVLESYTSRPYSYLSVTEVSRTERRRGRRRTSSPAHTCSPACIPTYPRLTATSASIR